jgi:hypothetical protein
MLQIFLSWVYISNSHESVFRDESTTWTVGVMALLMLGLIQHLASLLNSNHSSLIKETSFFLSC